MTLWRVGEDKGEIEGRLGGDFVGKSARRDGRSGDGEVEDGINCMV